MLAPHFSRFFAANPGLLHFAAHSHHPWPDVTQAAHARYWEDSATLADRKWAHVFGTVVPGGAGARRAAARALRPAPGRLRAQHARVRGAPVFVPRLVAAGARARERARVPQLPAADAAAGGDGPARAHRDSRRALGDVRRALRRGGAPRATGTSCGSPTCSSIPASSCAISSAIVARGACRRAGGDRRLPRLPRAAGRPLARSTRAPSTSPAATSTRWRAKAPASSRSRRAASCGPPTRDGSRPSTRSRAGPGEAVPYSADAFRFWGSTFDPSGLYRFNAVMDWLAGLGVTVARHPRPRAAAAVAVPGRACSARARAAAGGEPRAARGRPARQLPRLRRRWRRRGAPAPARRGGLRRSPRPAPALRLRRLPRRGRGRRPPRSDGEGPAIESFP